MSDLGTILQRMGAGFQGNLAEFDATRSRQQMLEQENERARRKEAQTLSTERATAAAQDAQIALQYLDQGAVDKALQLVDNRIGYINQFKGDPSDTQAVRDLIASGDIEGAKNELKLFTTAAESRGLIKPLLTPTERTAQGKLALDQAEFEAKYGNAAPGASGSGASGSASPSGSPSMGGIEGAKLALDKQKLTLEQQKAAREQAQFEAQQKDIPEAWRKQYVDSIDGELSATQKAAELSQLAADFDATAELPAGARATFDEAAKKFFGEQDAVTALRERFRGGRNSQVLKNLPPGVASDKDIEIAMSGFPSDKAPKANITSFLKGQVKIQALDAAYQRFKVDYIDENKTLRGINSAWRKEADRVFADIQKEIERPLNKSYTIQDYEAEARKRGLIKP